MRAAVESCLATLRVAGIRPFSCRHQRQKKSNEPLAAHHDDDRGRHPDGRQSRPPRREAVPRSPTAAKAAFILHSSFFIHHSPCNARRICYNSTSLKAPYLCTMFSIFKKNTVVIRKRPDHNVSRKLISREALRVLYRLSDSGYKAYLVGGGVRDILLGREPKDFDVATDAQPREIKRLFNRCFLVGRRFRLAHVVFGRTVIETATFRKQPPPGVDAGNGDLYQTDDNTFGTPEEDAKRRDFTVNGIFYDIKSFDLIDYVGGLKDLEKRILRSIGDPNTRFCEDPVRMMRAVRLSCKLGLSIEKASYKAIVRHAKEIEKASIPRVLEEIFRLFTYGASSQSFKLMWKTELLAHLMPHLNEFINESGGAKSELWASLDAFDELMRDNQEESSYGLRVAVTYLPMFMEGLKSIKNQHSREARFHLAEKVIRTMSDRYQLPRAALYHAAHLLDELVCFEMMPPKGRTIRQSRVEQFKDAILLARVASKVYGKIDEKNIKAWSNLRVIPNRERKPDGDDNKDNATEEQ